MSEIRSANMEKRRERILEQARSMLGRGGYDALNLRDLASDSGVTVPTIYNLVGNKAAILRALVMGSFATFEREVENRLPCPTAKMPALMMNTLQDIIAEDEDAFRATALATDRLESISVGDENYGFKRAPLKQYCGELCQCAREEGLLRGEIAADILVEAMVGIHQMAFRDWAHRSISLEELTTRSLQGIYVTLAGDATSDYREQLKAALERL